MDYLKAPFLLAAGLATEVGFLGGLLDALSLSNIPHTPEQLGRAFGLGVLFLLSQLFQLWARRKGSVHLVRGIRGLVRAVRSRTGRKAPKHALNRV